MRQSSYACNGGEGGTWGTHGICSVLTAHARTEGCLGSINFFNLKVKEQTGNKLAYEEVPRDTCSSALIMMDAQETHPCGKVGYKQLSSPAKKQECLAPSHIPEPHICEVHFVVGLVVLDG